MSSSIFVDSLVQAGVFARGSNLGTDHPTYYSATITRGLEVKLWKVVDGEATPLGTVRSQDWVSGMWVQTSLVLDGDRQQVQVFRSDTGQYLKPDGSWSLAPAFALTAADTAVQAGGRAGLSRGTGYAGQLVFDNFVVTAAPDSGAAPIPTDDDKPTTPKPPGDDLPGTDTPPPVVTPTEPAAPQPVEPAGAAAGRSALRLDSTGQPRLLRHAAHLVRA